MKLIILLSTLYILNPMFKNIPVSNNQSKITIIDSKTGEELCGVLNKNGNNYTNLNGDMIVKKGDELYLNLISYKELKVTVYNDTIIKLENL